MRSKKEILAAAEKRIAHLEYFEKFGQLKETQRADLELLKELVALVEMECEEGEPNEK